MKIVAYNPPTKHLEKSYLGRSYAAGTTSFLVKNSDRFVVGQRILLGEMGRERSEILTVDTIANAKTITTTTGSEFPHDADDPVYALEYDQVRIYRSTSGVNGAYNLLATVDIDVDNADNATYYNDVNALNTYFYRIAYYDSVEDMESERTDPIAAAGYDPRALGTIIPEVAKEIRDPDFLEVDLDLWLIWMNNTNADLITQAKRPYRFLKSKVTLDAEEGDPLIPLPADLWKIDFIEVNESTPAMSRVYRPKMVSATEARFQLAQYINPGDYVTAVAVDDEARELIYYPAARTLRLGAFTLHYYKDFTRFTSLADIIEAPNSLVYKLGLKTNYYFWKADDDNKYMVKAKDYQNQYNTEILKLQREKNIMADGPRGMGPDRKKYLQFGGRRYRQ